MKKYAHNVILVMSGGVGARFGTDCPKQYNIMDNRMVIDYVIDACRKTKAVDEIVIVANEGWVDFVKERYNVPTVAGGSTRPESVLSGIKYIHDHYDCDKLIITNAVCPLATSEQYDKYFHLLDEYDFILTTWKLAPALQRFDGKRVDRDDFFNVMEPDAYRFKMLWDNYDFKNLKKYIFHNMPLRANAYYCFDYPYTMKLTYPHDLKLLKVLYDELIHEPEEESTLQVVNKYLSADGTNGIEQWITKVKSLMKEMTNRYALTSYELNCQTEANIVYEAHSNKYGDIIFKFTPSDFHFHKEYTYYSLSAKGIMAELVDTDADNCMLVIRTIKPGFQVRFDVANEQLQLFFDNVNSNMISEDRLNGDNQVPNVMSEFDLYVSCAGKFTWEYELRKYLEQKAYRVWEKYFKNAPKFYLHRDMHRRNLLRDGEHIVAIDPRGSIGPRAFEYVIQFIIELREYAPNLNKDLYNQMFSYFTKYVSAEELNAALFIFWVYKMNDYVFQKNDNYFLASWCKQCILELYYEGKSPLISNDK